VNTSYILDQGENNTETKNKCGESKLCDGKKRGVLRKTEIILNIRGTPSLQDLPLYAKVWLLVLIH